MATPVDESRLEEKHNLLRLSVLSSHAISNRTTAVVKHLAAASSDDDKIAICALRAKAHVANKLVSIIEIAKRELTSSGIDIYQYNNLASEIAPLKERDDTSRALDTTGDGDDDAFQTMEKPNKIRATPVLTIYLAKTSIRELKDILRYVEVG